MHIPVLAEQQGGFLHPLSCTVAHKLLSGVLQWAAVHLLVPAALQATTYKHHPLIDQAWLWHLALLCSTSLAGMQAAYSLVYAAQQAAPQSAGARWLMLQLSRQLDPLSNPDTCGYLEALDLAAAVQGRIPHSFSRQLRWHSL